MRRRERQRKCARMCVCVSGVGGMEGRNMNKIIDESQSTMFKFGSPTDVSNS